MKHPPTIPTNQSRSISARILSIDQRRGTANALDEYGRKHKLPWGIIARLPRLLSGASVQVTFDTEGAISDVRIPK